KADDLINRLETDALAEVKTRHPDLQESEQQDTAHAIAIGALRYFLLKFTRNSIIAFDFREALSFEGETGPYCQYAAVRANSIFRKLDADAQQLALESVNNDGNKTGLTEVLQDEAGTEIWSLILLAERFDEVIAQAANSAEPANLAKYTFALARAFNLFYHRHRTIAAAHPLIKVILGR